MPEQTPDVHRIAHISLQCQCGAVVLVCWCAEDHPRRLVLACGVCTYTGTQPETGEDDS